MCGFFFFFFFFFLLAHLSKAQDELFCDHLLSVVGRRPSVRPSIPFRNFSSVTRGPIFFKLHVEPSIKRGIEN